MPKTVLPMVWPHVEGYLDAAMRRADMDHLDGVREDVFAQQALLWVTWDGKNFPAALVTKIVKPYHTKMCLLIACGGQGDWPELIKTIEDYARSEGCAITRIYGRPGWRRVLPGYRSTRVILDKEL